MRFVISLCVILLLHLQGQAQEEFLLGKSANALENGATVISAEYNVFAFENIRSRRVGIDLAYGLTDRFSLSLRGSASDFSSGALDFETGSITGIYQVGKKSDVRQEWAFAPFVQVGIIGRFAQVPGDINLDQHSSGFSVGMIVNRNMEFLTISGSLAYAKVNFPRLVDGLLDGSGLLFQLSVNQTLNMLLEKNRYQLGFLGELMGQTNNTIGLDGNEFFSVGSYLDFLGGLQFTANNTYRVELAVQTEVFGNVQRFSEGLYHIRLKYLIW